jgi:hypothetical protein
MSWVQLDEKQQEEKKLSYMRKKNQMKMKKKPDLLVQVSRLRLRLTLETIFRKGFELWLDLVFRFRFKFKVSI